MTDLEKLALEEIIRIDEEEHQKMIKVAVKLRASTEPFNIESDIYPIKHGRIKFLAQAILDNADQIKD